MIIDQIEPIALMKYIDIAAGPADEHIIPAATHQHIITGMCPKHLGVRGAGQRVGLVSADHRIHHR